MQPCQNHDHLSNHSHFKLQFASVTFGNQFMVFHGYHPHNSNLDYSIRPQHSNCRLFKNSVSKKFLLSWANENSAEHRIDETEYKWIWNTHVCGTPGIDVAVHLTPLFGRYAKKSIRVEIHRRAAVSRSCVLLLWTVTRTHCEQNSWLALEIEQQKKDIVFWFIMKINNQKVSRDEWRKDCIDCWNARS